MERKDRHANVGDPYDLWLKARAKDSKQVRVGMNHPLSSTGTTSFVAEIAAVGKYAIMFIDGSREFWLSKSVIATIEMPQ